MLVWLTPKIRYSYRTNVLAGGRLQKILICL